MTTAQIQHLRQRPPIRPLADTQKLRKTATNLSNYMRSGWHGLTTVMVSTATLVSFIVIAVSLIMVALFARIPAAIHERLQAD